MCPMHVFVLDDGYVEEKLTYAIHGTLWILYSECTFYSIFDLANWASGHFLPHTISFEGGSFKNLAPMDFLKLPFYAQADVLGRALPPVYLYLCHPYPTVAASAHSLYLGILQVAEEVSTFPQSLCRKSFPPKNLSVCVGTAFPLV